MNTTNSSSTPVYLQPASLGLAVILLYFAHTYDESYILSKNSPHLAYAAQQVETQAQGDIGTSSDFSQAPGGASILPGSDAEKSNIQLAQAWSGLAPRVESSSSTINAAGNDMEAVEIKKQEAKALNSSPISPSTSSESSSAAPSSNFSHSSVSQSETEALAALNPKLRPVCACESAGRWTGTPRQFDANGDPLMNFGGTGDVGMCQINVRYHEEDAKALGYDLYTSMGNVLFANYLFSLQGYQPWLASEACWRNAL
ncbi:MAG TPA: hypothetical protein VFM02_03095 [Candidatus Paceibacterota bacterium]|nr:hypothetical protein [Candidatus Paceibacterota bacterium]